MKKLIILIMLVLSCCQASIETTTITGTLQIEIVDNVYNYTIDNNYTTYNEYTSDIDILLDVQGSIIIHHEGIATFQASIDNVEWETIQAYSDKKVIIYNVKYVKVVTNSCKIYEIEGF